MMTALLLAVLAPLVEPGRPAADWERSLEQLCRDCPLAVIGRVERVGPGNTGTVAVRRVLKGTAGPTVTAEFRLAPDLTVTPDDADVVWFFRRQLDGGRWLMTDWKWSASVQHRALRVIRVADRRTRLPGTPDAPRGDGPVVVALGVEDDAGRVSAAGRGTLLARLENRGPGDVSVLPLLDGSTSHARYPHYDLDVTEADGRPVTPLPGARCGTLDPLRAGDVVRLRPGEGLYTPGPTPALPPGAYRVRLRYTVRPHVPEFGRDSVMVLTAWAGTAASNWVSLEVPPPAGRRAR